MVDGSLSVNAQTGSECLRGFSGLIAERVVGA